MILTPPPPKKKSKNGFNWRDYTWQSFEEEKGIDMQRIQDRLKKNQTTTER